MSTLQEAVLAGEYACGAEMAAALHAPTADDLRWWGVCLFQQGRVIEASRPLERAAQGGCRGAHIDIAALLRSGGQHAQALQRLLPLSPGELPPLDRALWFRERAILGHELGESRTEVIAWLDEAWAAASATPEAVQASVAHAYGIYAARFGDDHLASAYLEFAAGRAHPVRGAYVQLARVSCAAHLGDLETARAVLATLTQAAVPSPSPLGALLAFYEGTVGRVAGEDEAAGEAFRRAVTSSRASLRSNTEFHAWLGLLALATAAQDRTAAQTALARARHLAHTPRDLAFLNWREGSWRATRGDEAGLALLHRALAFFREREHRREAVWAGLHVAEAQGRLGRAEDSRLTLAEVADAVAALGAGLSLAAELRLTPQVQVVLDSLPQGTYERRHLLQDAPPLPTRIELITLGTAEVRVNDRPVPLRLARTVEIAAYLLTTAGAGLAQVQRDLFPEVPPAQSKSYFHQARLDLRTRVPGLSVPYDEEKRQYHLQVDRVDFTWDVQALDHALTRRDALMMKHLERSGLEFLQNAESAWATQERERLRRWITQVGLETIDDWYRTGQYEKCISLAQQLLPLDPLDDALHKFLIRATLEVRGRAAALQVCRMSIETFRREVDDVPLSLLALGDQLGQSMLN